MGIDKSINLRNDLIFKFVFGYEKNERILIALLNAILGLEGEEKIIKLTFLNTFNLQEYIKDKLTTLDVNAEDNTGRRVNIEMHCETFADKPGSNIRVKQQVVKHLCNI